MTIPYLDSDSIHTSNKLMDYEDEIIRKPFAAINIRSNDDAKSKLMDNEDGKFTRPPFKSVNSRDFSTPDSKLLTDGDELLELPIGYRFSPTDKELIMCYLDQKSSGKDLPCQVIKEIDASEFYSKSPAIIVKKTCDDPKEKEWYFFINYDTEYFRQQERLWEDNYSKGDRIIDYRNGFWRFLGDEVPIYDDEGNICAFKIPYRYFSGSPSKNWTTTRWRQEEYRLVDENSDQEKWTVGKIIRGRNYI